MSQVIITLTDLSYCSENQHNFLNDYLKTKFRKSILQPFSLNFTPLSSQDAKNLTNFSTGSCFDLLILYKYELILMNAYNIIHLFNYHTKSFIRSIKTGMAINELTIDDDEIFLYASGSSTDSLIVRCSKFDIKYLLMGNEHEVHKNAIVWLGQEKILSNCWGISLFNNGNEKYVYVMDYETGLHVFDSETGQKVINVKVPEIDLGYGVFFTPEKEMIVSGNPIPVQIFKYDLKNKEWLSDKQATCLVEDQPSYGIYYEKCSELIYLVDCNGKKVSIFRKHDLKRIKTFYLETSNHCSIFIDERAGQLYLPNEKSACHIYQ